MADLIRRKDWSSTPLGPIASWPQSLRTTVSLCLASNFPINIIWGPEHTQIYNDGYRLLCGEAHPRALGEGYEVTWASAWPAIGGPFARALAGETSFLENQRMFLTRNGYLEETFFTFSLSPIRAEDGSIGGLFHPVTETTATMLAERRTRALRDLSSALDVMTESRGLAPAVLQALQPFAFDLPVLMFYELDADAQCYRLAAHQGVDAPAQQQLARLPLLASGAWPLREALRTQGMTVVDMLPGVLAAQACGPYPEPPSRAVLLPIHVPGCEHPPALIVALASPRLPFDEGYRNFLQLLGSSVTGLLGSVRALEDERRRATALAEIDRAKTAFFSNVSHEFRTPLTLLLGPLEDALHERESLAPQVGERLELAHRNALRLLKLVNSLLDFSRIEAGRARAVFEPVDLAALTADIASTFRSATDRAGLSLQIAAEPLPQPVYVDRAMWETVLLNLLSNAFKFTFEGFIRVEVHAKPGSAQAQVAVTDTGTGIPQPELPHLFDRFHRVEGAQGRSYEGSGIGLALVQELVKLHGGTIEVSSLEGRGTTFTVTLPYGQAHLQPEQVGSAGPGAGDTRASAYLEEALRWLPDTPRAPEMAGTVGAIEPGLRGSHVLLADDNADMRGYVARLLASQGMEVRTAVDGEDALAQARARLPDLVLSDVMMPRLDGFQLLAAIRADAALRQVPVMLLSARAGQEARVEGLAAGADDYLTKPFSARELVARVAANLRLNRERRQAAAAVAASEAQLRTVFQASYLFQGLLAPDGSVLDANATSLGVIEQPLSAVAGQPFWDTPWFAGTQGMSELVRESVQAAAAGQTVRREIRLELPVGGWREFDFTLRPVHGDDGRLLAIVSEAVEITDRKRVEAALREAQKLEAIGRLTGGVAHDFNNLMMVVSGGINVLERQPDPARQRQTLDGMRRAVEKGSALTRQLLTFGGNKPLAPQPIALPECIARMEALLNRTLGAQVRVVSYYAADLWPVLADQNELEMVLLNLGVNARDAMPNGGTVSITADNVNDPRGLPPGDYVRVAVGDTGAGMPEGVRERAFEPFFSTKEFGKGSGLGLAQVYGFAKESGGLAQIDSAPGRGTTITLLLPRSLAPAPTPAPNAAAAPKPLAVQAPRRVLLVEDDNEVAELVAEMLAHLGYQLVRAGTAAEALFTLEHDTRIDVVFSDVMMPGKLTGVDLARRVRRDRPELPVVLTSGYAESFKKEARNEGLVLLPKPYAMDELRMVMERALETKVH
jgi:signal transduction histidine kinase/DNA-binding response OmpR family regulator